MKRPEEMLQRTLVAYLRLALPAPWLCFHIPNGGGRSKAEAGILKAMGVLAGMPDLVVVGPGVVAHVATPENVFQSVRWSHPRVIAIELKAPLKPLKRGGVSKAKARTSDAQDEVIAQLGRCGVPTLIIRDVDEAIRALRQLGVPLKAVVR